MPGSFVLALGALATVIFVRFIYAGYMRRSKLHGLPGPPHSMLWGHLKILGEYTTKVLPPSCHPHWMPLLISRKYNLGPLYYLDVWPFSDPLLTVFDPSIMDQITVEHNAPKHSAISLFTESLSGPGDLVGANGAHWKKWRSILNPGFAAGHLMTLVPSIVDQCLIFTEKLAKHASEDRVFRLEEDATRLTVDIIGKVALDTNLNSQTSENRMVNAFREQVHLLPNGSFVNPFTYYAPRAVLRRRNNQRYMRNELGRILDERFLQTNANAKTGAGGRKQRRRAVVDLALDSYLSMQASNDNEKGEPPAELIMDAEFRDQAITQCLIFIFAGHDTTSSTICYAFYLLQKHPDCLARLRKEHEEILGSTADTPDAIKNDAYVLNKLEYTLAVIKETLRLFPPASTPRQGDKNLLLRHPKTGELLPTEGCLVWVVHLAMHRDPNVWGEDALEFKPERFLPENSHKLPQGAWRPFETGPRKCIGIELAMIETKVILALLARSFEFKPAFDELDLLENDGSTYAKDKSLRKGRQDVEGEQAYQLLIATAKPREGMPMRVKQIK